MAERLVEVDYSAGEGLTLRFKPRSLGLIPEPTRGHIRAANRELLLALRSFVDQVIEGMEPEENTPPPPPEAPAGAGEGLDGRDPRGVAGLRPSR